MKKQLAMIVLGVAMATALLPAQARNVKYMIAIDSALASETAATGLDSSIKSYFGPQTYPGTAKTIARIDTTSKMQIQAKADVAACNAAFVDALRTLQKNARDAGGNAVVNIVSYFKNGPAVSSATEYECHAGSYTAYVMLKGQLVKIDGK
jgi:uncharacterized protein YbjQ (UPF0145 family)